MPTNCGLLLLLLVDSWIFENQPLLINSSNQCIPVYNENGHSTIFGQKATYALVEAAENHPNPSTRPMYGSSIFISSTICYIPKQFSLLFLEYPSSYLSASWWFMVVETAIVTTHGTQTTTTTTATTTGRCISKPSADYQFPVQNVVLSRILFRQ
jgi:hypothetical protein